MSFDSLTVHTLPTPISRADRALIDAFEDEHGITHIARGVSGMDDQRETSSKNWRGGRANQPAGLRTKLSERRQLYRKLFDEGKTVEEIAALVGVSVRATHAALKRMRLKITSAQTARLFWGGDV